MYRINDVIKGAPKLLKSVMNRKREYQIQFNKEKDGCWYVDFPHWPFSHDNLAMVSGADKMLELLSDGDLFVRVSIIPTKEQELHDDYIELEQTKSSLFSGITYHVKYEPFKERFKRDTLWICPVTVFVLGHYPKFIYVKKMMDNYNIGYDQPQPATVEDIFDNTRKEKTDPVLKNTYFVTHNKDRKLYLKYTNGNEASVIVVRVIGDEEIIYDNRYSIDFITWADFESEPIEISEKDFDSVFNKQTDIVEYVARKVACNETFYISMTAEDGMEIFEFEGRKYKRSVGTVIDEGIVEGRFDDVDLDFVVSWAKHRGGACNILSKSDFEEWWKKLK